jgi:hypothetical protein
MQHGPIHVVLTLHPPLLLLLLTAPRLLLLLLQAEQLLVPLLHELHGQQVLPLQRLLFRLLPAPRRRAGRRRRLGQAAQHAGQRHARREPRHASLLLQQGLLLLLHGLQELCHGLAAPGCNASAPAQQRGIGAEEGARQHHAARQRGHGAAAGRQGPRVHHALLRLQLLLQHEHALHLHLHQLLLLLLQSRVLLLLLLLLLLAVVDVVAAATTVPTPPATASLRSLLLPAPTFPVLLPVSTLLEGCNVVGVCVGHLALQVGGVCGGGGQRIRRPQAGPALCWTLCHSDNAHSETLATSASVCWSPTCTSTLSLCSSRAPKLTAPPAGGSSAEAGSSAVGSLSSSKTPSASPSSAS